MPIINKQIEHFEVWKKSCSFEQEINNRVPILNLVSITIPTLCF